MKISNRHHAGFSGLIAVISISLGILVTQITVLSSAVLYADSVRQKEYRFLARNNTEECLAIMKIKYSRDYFLNGTTTIPILNCQAVVTNDFSGNIQFDIKTEFQGVEVELFGGF